jgi:hypothetical protein
LVEHLHPSKLCPYEVVIIVSDISQEYDEEWPAELSYGGLSDQTGIYHHKHVSVAAEAVANPGT